MIDNSILIKIVNFANSVKIITTPYLDENGNIVGYKTISKPYYGREIATPILPIGFQIKALRESIVKQLIEDATNGKPLRF